MPDDSRGVVVHNRHMHKPSVILLSVLAVSLLFLDRAIVRAAEPGTTRPSSMSTTEPTTAPVAMVELTGYVAPIDAQELKFKPKRFAGPLTVTEVISNGGSVKSGQPLIRFDFTELDQGILEATSDLEVAKAALVKAQVDASIGERADAATLEERTDAVTDAERNFAWWRDIEGPDFLKRLDQTVQSSQDGVDDQNDELDQLRKMYKSEELTNATADIVVKRAVRSLQRSQEALEVTHHAADKQKATTYGDQLQAVTRAVDAAKRALESATADTAESRVTRAASLLKARVAQRDAEKKLSELEKDKAALGDVTAKADGVVYYGAFVAGTWQGVTDEAIKVGEVVDSGKAVLTLIQPTKLRVIAKVDEANLFKVESGTSAKIEPIALPGTKIDGVLAKRDAAAGADGATEQKVDLQNPDARLLAGMKVKIEIQPTTRGTK